VLYDGTYFHKDGCHISLMDARTHKIIAHIWEAKEGYKTTIEWFKTLCRQGLEPLYFIMDGERSVIRAIQEVWPAVKIQRCLYHIQREGMRWLRSTPKTEAGVMLRALLKTLCRIRTQEERGLFLEAYKSWLLRYREEVLALPRAQVAYKDLKKTMRLIGNAIPDMFHYLEDPRVPNTTNKLEGYYSRLKADYRRHRGLSKEHRVSYLAWYIHFHNEK
jgi:transposase-like protein